MLAVPTNIQQIQQLVYNNGDEARFVHPHRYDGWQKYLISGCSWQIPIISLNGTTTGGLIPLILRPWTSHLLIGLKGVISDPDTAECRIVLYESDGVTRLSLGGDLVVDKSVFPNISTPLGEQAWSGVPWAFVGGSGMSTPPVGDNSGCIQIAPVNAWQYALLSITLTDTALNNLYVRTWCSPQQLTLE